VCDPCDSKIDPFQSNIQPANRCGKGAFDAYLLSTPGM
jgi:hypothetical protein